MFGLYTKLEATNKCILPKDLSKQIMQGGNQVVEHLGSTILNAVRSQKKCCSFGFDGFLGVDWEKLILPLREYLIRHIDGIELVDIRSCYKNPGVIDRMIAKCISEDPHFGYVYKGRLKDFFDNSRLSLLRKRIKSIKNTRNRAPSVVICYGMGAAIPELRTSYDQLCYVDITREQLLNRFEEHKATLLGDGHKPVSSSELIKRLSYVDYQVLKIQKRYVFKYIDYYIEQNEIEKPILFPRDVYDRVIAELSETPFRLKPIYIMRVWGGQYLKKIRQLPDSMPGCAFSLELVAAEQVLRIQIDEIVAEIPFLNFIWQRPQEILGKHSIRRFGIYFPLTSNYDDTYKGGSLAVQVHPDTRYMRRMFNEYMRHDESYYIVKSWSGARTYHGFTDSADLDELYELCSAAEKQKIPFDYNQFINSWPSNPGDLFLLPAGTVHASGENQLVLEMDMDGSKNGTEYTFHLYDYLRTDLNGKYRPIHVEHAFNVIKSFRRTRWVGEHLKPYPKEIRRGETWAEYLLGKRKDMSYEIHRIEFEDAVEDKTRDRFHVLTLVEGDKVTFQSKMDPHKKYEIGFTETVIIPARIGPYQIINTGESARCKITKMHVK